MKNSLYPGNYLRGLIKKSKQLSLLPFGRLKVFMWLGLLIGANACTESKVPQEWSGITVNVKADNAVETSQKMTSEEGGLQRLDVTLSNKGTEIVFIDSIEIRIPVNETITNEMNIAYGSSCMRQRPVLIHKVSEPQKKIKEIAPTANLIQIDAGWYSQRGDFAQLTFPGA
jgi:hypothetical protein